jgi:hypothetical protein
VAALFPAGIIAGMASRAQGVIDAHPKAIIDGQYAGSDASVSYRTDCGFDLCHPCDMSLGSEQDDVARALRDRVRRYKSLMRMITDEQALSAIWDSITALEAQIAVMSDPTQRGASE